jgi:hypothetical protein
MKNILDDPTRNTGDHLIIQGGANTGVIWGSRCTPEQAVRLAGYLIGRCGLRNVRVLSYGETVWRQR